MRIIAGTLGGRQFQSPKGYNTHPMSEKARGAMFNMLGDIKGLTMLDAFAGSGALSFEAVSRGATEVLAIEMDKAAQGTIKRNITDLGLEKWIRLFSGNCLRWSQRNRTVQFDIVLCDPPYDRILTRSIQKLVSHVKNGGILVLSWPGQLKADTLIDMEQIKVTSYGDIQLVFYRRFA